MYFPYLRGRQFEVIAIRQLLEMKLISQKIVPIIEPVKLSSTLIKTMNLYVEQNRSIVIVYNPVVGSFRKDLNEAKKADLVQKYNDIFMDERVIKGHIVNQQSNEQLVELEQFGISKNKIVTINLNRNCLSKYKELFNEVECLYNLIPDDRKFGREVANNKVLFANSYNKLSRNVDYLDVDEFFSDDHLYFNKEGYIGYSDYSIVGDDYSESGFAPYAVAIHLVYFNTDEELNIIHFVSNSNDDIRDPGNKFYEAVEKLYIWGKDKTINTYGYNELIKHYKQQTYPGLGVVKKLCIMHHLELVSQYFEGAK